MLYRFYSRQKGWKGGKDIRRNYISPEIDLDHNFINKHKLIGKTGEDILNFFKKNNNSSFLKNNKQLLHFCDMCRIYSWWYFYKDNAKITYMNLL